MELLVVVVIIGILPSMLLPALKTSRDLKNAACINNLKQIGLANYVSDWDKILPCVGWFDNNPQTYSGKNWGKMICQYARYRNFDCHIGSYVTPAIPVESVNYLGNTYKNWLHPTDPPPDRL